MRLEVVLNMNSGEEEAIWKMVATCLQCYGEV